MKSFNISEAEWKVMKVLWDKPNVTLKEISDCLKDTGWSYSTIRTLVTRLMEKGAADADKSAANNFKYFPAVSENDCQIQETKRFIDRVFDGSVSMLMSSLVKKSNLSPEEVAELKSIIDKIEGGDK